MIPHWDGMLFLLQWLWGTWVPCQTRIGLPELVPGAQRGSSPLRQPSYMPRKALLGKGLFPIISFHLIADADFSFTLHLLNKGKKSQCSTHSYYYCEPLSLGLRMPLMVHVFPCDQHNPLSFKLTSFLFYCVRNAHFLWEAKQSGIRALWRPFRWVFFLVLALAVCAAGSNLAFVLCLILLFLLWFTT